MFFMIIFAGISTLLDDRCSWVTGNMGEKSELKTGRLYWIELCVNFRIISSEKSAKRNVLYFKDGVNVKSNELIL